MSRRTQNFLVVLVVLVLTLICIGGMIFNGGPIPIVGPG